MNEKEIVEDVKYVDFFFNSLDDEVAKMFRYFNNDAKHDVNCFFSLPKTHFNVASMEELYYNLHYFFLIKDNHLDMEWKNYEKADKTLQDCKKYVHHFGVIITILINKAEQYVDVNKVKKNNIDVLEARKIMKYNINVVQSLLTQRKYLITFKCFYTMKMMKILSEIIDF